MDESFPIGGGGERTIRDMKLPKDAVGNRGLRPWQPGHYGNPSGCPKGTRELAQLVLDDTANG